MTDTQPPIAPFPRPLGSEAVAVTRSPRAPDAQVDTTLVQDARCEHCRKREPHTWRQHEASIHRTVE